MHLRGGGHNKVMKDTKGRRPKLFGGKEDEMGKMKESNRGKQQQCKK